LTTRERTSLPASSIPSSIATSGALMLCATHQGDHCHKQALSSRLRDKFKIAAHS
jgi:hypothetical protein